MKNNFFSKNKTGLTDIVEKLSINNKVKNELSIIAEESQEFFKGEYQETSEKINLDKHIEKIINPDIIQTKGRPTEKGREKSYLSKKKLQKLMKFVEKEKQAQKYLLTNYQKKFLKVPSKKNK